MPIFLVPVREVWIQIHKIEAADEKEAIKLVAAGEGEALEHGGGFEYSHTLDSEYWTPVTKAEVADAQMD